MIKKRLYVPSGEVPPPIPGLYLRKGWQLLGKTRYECKEGVTLSYLRVTREHIKKLGCRFIQVQFFRGTAARRATERIQ